MLLFERYIVIAMALLMMLSEISFAQTKTLDLKDCIELALSNNKSVDIAQLTLGSKALDVKSYRNEQLPNVNGFSNMYTNFGQSQDIFGNSARNDNFNNSLGLASAYSIFSNGKLKNMVKKGEMELQASELDIALLKRNLSLKVIQGYLNVLLQKEISISTDSALIFAKNQLQKVQKSTDLGATSLTILYESKANFARETDKNTQAHYAVDKAMLDLKQIMGVSKDDILILNDHIDESKSNTILNVSDSSLYYSSISLHPTIKKYDYLNKSLFYDQKIIKSQLYPNVNLNLTFGSFYFNNLTTGVGKMPFFDQLRGNFSQQVGVSINVPIFNKYSVKTALAKNKIQLEENKKQVELEKQLIGQEIDKYLLDLSNFQKQYLSISEVLEITEKAFNLSLKSYEAGRISIYDLNSSRANLLSVESDLIRSKYNIAFTKVLISYLVNGGF